MMSTERKRRREDSKEILESSLFWRIKRELPSTAVLVTLASSRKKNVKIPLLEELLGEELGKKKLLEAEQKGEETDLHSIILDDPRKSTLTKGQHERYLRMAQGQKPQAYSHQQHREYRKLHLLVEAEQKAYCKARRNFFAKNAQRFLSGFRLMDSVDTHIDYVNWNAQYSKLCINEWKKHRFPVKFGEVRQKVALSLSLDAPVNDKKRTKNWVPTERFDSQVIFSEGGKSQANSNKEALADELPLAIPRKMKLPDVPLFVKNNEIALELAKRYGCCAIVSAEALEEILTQNRWKIPLWNSSPDLRILDHPIPQPMLPRTCITRGIENTLHSPTECAEDSSGMMYTLVKMQAEGNKQHHLLVQSRRYAMRKFQRIHLEYFPEHGLEELSAEEKSLWILDSLLAPLMPIELSRVNAEESNKEWKIHVRESVSVAHALACDSESMKRLWYRLILVLDTIVDGRLPINGDYLLTHQREIGDFMSLHHANDKEWVVNLEDEFQNADVVKTSNAALLACARPWKWRKKNQVLNTFPIKNTD